MLLNVQFSSFHTHNLFLQLKRVLISVSVIGLTFNIIYWNILAQSFYIGASLVSVSVRYRLVSRDYTLGACGQPSRTSEEPSELEEHGGAQEAQKADSGNTSQLLKEMTWPYEFAGEYTKPMCGFTTCCAAFVNSSIIAAGR